MSGGSTRGPGARLRRLLGADARNVARDPLFAFAAVFALAPALLLRVAGPAVDAFFADQLGLSDGTALLAPAAALTPAFMVGWMAGFVLLEERDEGVLRAVAATPVGTDGFLAYRMAVAALICLVSAPLAVAVIGVDAFAAGAIVSPLLGLFCALQAVLIALTLASVAGNKVEGLAVTKLINLALIPPILAGLETSWKWLAAPIPTFWVGLAAQAETPAALAVAAVGGLVVHLAATALALRGFRRRRG